MIRKQANKQESLKERRSSKITKHYINKTRPFTATTTEQSNKTFTPSTHSQNRNTQEITIKQ